MRFELVMSLPAMSLAERSWLALCAPFLDFYGRFDSKKQSPHLIYVVLKVFHHLDGWLLTGSSHC